MDMAGDEEPTQRRDGGVRCAWGTPAAQGSQFVSVTVVGKKQPPARSSRIVVPAIEQTISQVENKKKRKNPNKHS